MDNQVIELDYGQVEVDVDSVGQISLIFRNPYDAVLVPLWKDYSLGAVFGYLNDEGGNAQTLRLTTHTIWLIWRGDMLVIIDVADHPSTLPSAVWVQLSPQQLAGLQEVVLGAPDAYAKQKRDSTIKYLHEQIARCQTQLAEMEAEE